MTRIDRRLAGMAGAVYMNWKTEFMSLDFTLNKMFDTETGYRNFSRNSD